MLQLSSFSLSALPTFNPCWTHRFCLLNITGFSHLLSPLKHEGPESAVTIIFLSPTTLAASLTFWSVSCYHLYPYKKNWPGDHASHINLTNSLHNCKSFSTYSCLGEAINLSFLVQFPGSIFHQAFTLRGYHLMLKCRNSCISIHKCSSLHYLATLPHYT